MERNTGRPERIDQIKTQRGDYKMKGKPKKDGSGKGIRANKGRGGCSPAKQKKNKKNRR